MQDDWKRLRLVTRQFVICYSEDEEEKEEKSTRVNFSWRKIINDSIDSIKMKDYCTASRSFARMSQKGKKDGFRDENERLCMMIPFAR